MTKKLLSIGNYGLHLITTPNGRFSFVGSIPDCMVIEKKQGNGLPYYDAPSFQTEKEAIDYFESKKHLIK